MCELMFDLDQERWYESRKTKEQETESEIPSLSLHLTSHRASSNSPREIPHILDAKVRTLTHAIVKVFPFEAGRATDRTWRPGCSCGRVRYPSEMGRWRPGSCVRLLMCYRNGFACSTVLQEFWIT